MWPLIVRPAALVGDLLWGLLLIHRGESDPAVRLDCEQAADTHHSARALIVVGLPCHRTSF